MGTLLPPGGCVRPRANPQAPLDPALYKPMLDFIREIFGEDNIVYAGRSKQNLDVFRAYTMAMGRPAAEKFFWKNSVRAFRWVKRDGLQPEVA